MRLPIIHDETTIIECTPYRAKMFARSCAQRYLAAQRVIPLRQRQKGFHFRVADKNHCKNCDFGRYVLEELSNTKAETPDVSEMNVPALDRAEPKEKEDSRGAALPTPTDKL